MTDLTHMPKGDTAWFTRDRFGMFLHFGLYAMPGRHEQVKFREAMPEEKYDLYFKHFDPDLFDARGWARAIRAAGMRYVVLTAKHHDGFCLWDTQYTDYKITNTPFGRDLLKEFTDVCREEGLRFGMYYSLLDWHHPDFTIDLLHPRHGDADAKALNEGRDMRRYAQYMRDQVAELLTNYGDVDILWFDYSYAERNGVGDQAWMRGKTRDDWEAEALIALARSLCPGIIINNHSDVEQDLWNAQLYQPLEYMRHGVDGPWRDRTTLVWESCQTFGGLSWGYDRDDLTWKPPEMLVRMLVNAVSAGGNLMINAGPNGRGELGERTLASLAALGEWMRLHGRSIYGCAQSPYTPPADCRYTQRGNRLYLHLFSWPFRHLVLDGLADRIEYCQLLNDGSEIPWRTEDVKLCLDGRVVLDLPVTRPNVAVPVIEIFLKDAD